MTTIDPGVRALAGAANFATLTTFLPSGYAQTQVMWVDADDEFVLINTEPHRAKYTNVQRDKRVTVTIIDKENPYHFAEVRGDVVDEVRGQEARDHIDALSMKYGGKPYPPDAIQTERVILKIKPNRQLVRGARTS